MITSTFKLEGELLKNGYDFVIGIDEAGRGPLAGPVVACAACLRKYENLKNACHCERSEAIPNLSDKSRDCHSRSEAELLCNDKFFDLVRDSKTLSHKQRENLFDFIQEHFYVGVGICDHETIDRMNILEATFLAMKKAVNALTRNIERITKDGDNASRSTFHVPRSIILLDGNKPIPNFSAEQKAIVNGDKLVKSISAASIIAKVTRDRIMLAMHEKYPEYGFDKHKGYGTKLHFEMLQKYGPCKIHRRSFSPVSKSLHQFHNK